MLRPTNRRPGAQSQPEFSSLATALLTERVLRIATSYMLRPHCYRCRGGRCVIALDPFGHRATQAPFMFLGTHGGVTDDRASVSPYPGEHGRRPGIAPRPLTHNTVVQSSSQAKEEGVTGGQQGQRSECDFHVPCLKAINRRWRDTPSQRAR